MQTGWKNGQAKRSIEEGCARLQASQAPGQIFTAGQIAKECEVDQRAIVFIERRAMLKLARGLHKMNPGFFEEVLHGRPITEVLDNLGRDPYRTGRPAVRPKKVQKKKIDSCRVSLNQVRRELEHRNGSARWGRKRAWLYGGQVVAPAAGA